MKVLARIRTVYFDTCRYLWYAGHPLIVCALFALFVAAVSFRAAYELHRLLLSSGRLAGIDLRLRFEEVHAWFAGDPVYGVLGSAIYPPATYLMIWPLVGCTDWQVVRWIWAITSVAALIVFVKIVLSRYSLNGQYEKPFWALFVLAHYSTGIVIGNGQLTIHVLTALAVCMALMTPRRGGAGGTLGAGFLAAWSLVKPTVSAPFMWLVLMIPGRGAVRAGIIVLIYACCAAAASIFQGQGIFELHRRWIAHVARKSTALTAWPPEPAGDGRLPSMDTGYGDLISLFNLAGMDSLAFPASLALFPILGLIVYRFRDCNPWILMGVVAIAARVWTYHRVYDDMLIIFAVLSVAAVVREGRVPGTGGFGRILLPILIICSVIPASLRLLPPPWDLCFKLGQMTLWCTTIAYLIACLRTESNQRTAHQMRETG